MTNMDRIVRAVRQNPEGLLLLGAGVALMLRSSIASESSAKVKVQSRSPLGQRSGPTNMQHGAGEPGLMQTVSDGVSGIQEAVAGAAQDLGDKASDFGQAAADRAKRMAGGARSSMEEIVEAQPVAVAIAGIAVGCLAAAFLPTSRLESETLRPYGKQAVDALSNAGERVKQATLKAGEQLVDAAAERGLNKQGLSEMARDVASEFKSNVTEGADAKSPAAPASNAPKFPVAGSPSHGR